MTGHELVVLGGGEHARVVIDAARSVPGSWRVTGFTDPGPADRTVEVTGIDRLGDDEAFAGLFSGTVASARPTLVLGIGLPSGAAARQVLAARFAGASWAVVVHRSATVSPSAVVGQGTVVLAGAVINAGASIGRHAIVNTGAVVEHDVTVGDNAHIAPGAVIGGGAAIGADALIGLGALVRDHVTVGAGATVGMGATVVADVPPGVTVVGNPARVMVHG